MHKYECLASKNEYGKGSESPHFGSAQTSERKSESNDPDEPPLALLSSNVHAVLNRHSQTYYRLTVIFKYLSAYFSLNKYFFQKRKNLLFTPP
ncbi:MAG: hypothetical protein KKC46_15165 [Proteobacteria bacterium]|nr:hypothetical protein [Pseudomonadota bacterium]